MKALWLVMLLGITMLVADDLITRRQRDLFQKLSERASASLAVAHEQLEDDKVRMEHSIVIITNITEILQWQLRASKQFNWMEGKMQTLDHRLTMDENALSLQTNASK